MVHEVIILNACFVSINGDFDNLLKKTSVNLSIYNKKLGPNKKLRSNPEFINFVKSHDFPKKNILL